MEIIQLSPRRPYLVRAFYEWLLDNRLTPHLLVDITVKGIEVPIEFASDGKMVLNIVPQAVAYLKIGNEKIQFNASFNDVQHQVVVPMAAVLAIYSRENGVGTMFAPEVAYEQQVVNTETSLQDEKSKIVKLSIDGHHPENGKTKKSDDKPPIPYLKKRPSLQIVK